MGLHVTFQLPSNETRKRPHDGLPSQPGKARKAPAFFDQLTDQIASRIFVFLGRKDLLQVAPVNRRFYQLARAEFENILFERFFLPPEVVVNWPLSRMMKYSVKVDEIENHIRNRYSVLFKGAYSRCFFFSEHRRLLVDPTLLHLLCMDSPMIAEIFSNHRVYKLDSKKDGSEYKLTMLLNELFLIVGPPNLALRPLVPEKLRKKLGLALQEACQVNTAGIMERIFAAGAKLDFGLLSTAVEWHAKNSVQVLLDHASHPNKDILKAQTLAFRQNSIELHEMISRRLSQLGK